MLMFVHVHVCAPTPGVRWLEKEESLALPYIQWPTKQTKEKTRKKQNSFWSSNQIV